MLTMQWTFDIKPGGGYRPDMVRYVLTRIETFAWDRPALTAHKTLSAKYTALFPTVPSSRIFNRRASK